MGSKKKPFYRLVAADSRMARDGRFIETLGYYNPLVTPADVKVNEELVFKWLGHGAIMSTSCKSLLRRLGLVQKWELQKRGVTADQLDTHVEAIKAKQDEATTRRTAKKRGALSVKAKTKRAGEAAAAAAPQETPPAA
jgi:small subunit ribosomal protein S16